MYNFYDRYKNFLLICLIILFSGSLQINYNIKIINDGLNISLSDLLLPFMFILTITLIFKKKIHFFNLYSNNIFLGFFILSIYLSFTLFNGYLYSGEFTNWALINKFFGWFVLLLYFISGVLISNLSKNFNKIFVTSLFVLGLFFGFYDYYNYFLYYFGFERNLDYQRMTGFLKNPNAYGVLMSIIFMTSLVYTSKNIIFSKLLDYIFLGILLSFSIFSGSKSVILGFIVIFFFLIFKRLISFKRIFKVLLISIIFSSVTIFGNTIKNFTNTLILKNINESEVSNLSNKKNLKKVPNYYVELAKAKIDTGIKSRIKISYEGILLWQDKPLLGIGLGSFLHNQIKSSKNITLHSTPLWILVEMGIVGLMLFSIFFIYILIILFNKNEFEKNVMTVSSILILIFFAGASLGTELMYQRYIWFILGCGVAFPKLVIMR